MRLIKLFVLIGTLTVAVAASQPAAADPAPPYNFDAVLQPAEGGSGSGSGTLRFRQPGNAERVVYLQTHLWELLPNSSYRLQRATDAVVDDNCSGTNWLTLGRDNFTPLAIETNHRGGGHARFSRDLAAVPAGTQLDIHFRVIDAADAVVLASPCYQFTVR